MKKTTAAGGTPQILCDAPNGSGGAWNSDGVILFSPGIFTGLSRISAAGGAPMPSTKLDTARKDNSHRWPWFLPDGRHYIFMIRSPESGIYLGELGSWQNKRLVGNDSAAIYSPPGKNSRLGYLLFTRGDTLMAQMVDMTKAQMLGEPILAASDVLSDSLRNKGSFSVSTNGRLVLDQFSKEASARRLVYLDRAGFQHGEALSEDTYVHISLSPDGKRAALQRSDRGIQETWLMDLATRKSTRFAVNHTFPVWSPDGKRILLFVEQDGVFGLRHKAVNGADQSELLAPSKDPKFPLDWPADGRYVLYQQNNLETGNDLMLAPASGGAPLPYLQTAANEEDGKISPDGRWIAYTSDESGGREVYVQRFLPPGPAAASEPRWQISVRGGGKPVWSRDGRELFYIAGNRNLMSVRVKTAAPGIFESGPPGTLFPARLGASDPTQQYAISADGRGIFVLQQVIASPSPLTVVLDWTAVLRQ